MELPTTITTLCEQPSGKSKNSTRQNNMEKNIENNAKSQATSQALVSCAISSGFRELGVDMVSVLTTGIGSINSDKQSKSTIHDDLAQKRI